jgi:hypothetical protein
VGLEMIVLIRKSLAYLGLERILLDGNCSVECGSGLDSVEW